MRKYNKLGTHNYTIDNFEYNIIYKHTAYQPINNFNEITLTNTC